MFFNSEFAWRRQRLIVCSFNRVAGVALAIGVDQVCPVSKRRSESSADVLPGERFDAIHHLSMADAAAGLETRLNVATPRCVTGITLSMRGNSERRLFGGRFVTVAAIYFPAIGQSVRIHMVRVLLAIKVSVVFVPRGEISLWRARGEPLFLTVTDGADL
jgi:hypothetical protein